MTPGAQAWHHAQLALQCLAQDPKGLGGIVIRARSGPVRDACIATLTHFSLPVRRIHPSIADDQLFGGVDIATTLESGRVVRTAGLLSKPAAFVLSMSERCPSQLAARLGQYLDRGDGGCLILLDEGADADEMTPAVLTERVAFYADLTEVAVTDLGSAQPTAPHATEDTPDDNPTLTVQLAEQFGINGARASLFAHRCARAHARCHGRPKPTQIDVVTAAALVFPHRATRIPEPQDSVDAPADAQAQPEMQPDTESQGPDSSMSDVTVEAVKALLPADVLARLGDKPGVKQQSHGSGAGIRQKSNRRGRPLPPRPGQLDGRNRIDLFATLKAAVPWQAMRRATRPSAPGLIIRASDLRVRRYEDCSDRLLIFTVDASGSAAVSRLNEAKGAVEIMLAQAYARRDHVALISFRGSTADLLLPPTRSLLQTKKRLAALPGGGGTPMAAGLQQAEQLARQSRGRGMTPTLVLLTDGRANVALDGSANRAQAADDSETMARTLRAAGVPGIMIDMSKRPQPALQALAATLDAPYLPLPHADAHQMSKAVDAALETA